MMLSRLIVDFLEYLEVSSNVSLFTIRNYNHYLKRFSDFCGDIVPMDINPELIKKYRLYLSTWVDPRTKKTLKKITQNYFMIAIRAFLRYLEDQNIEVLSPEKVELRKQERLPVKVLDEEALQQLFDGPVTNKKEGLRDRAILETLFLTGHRASELVSLNKGEFSSFWVEKYLSQRKDAFKPLFIRFQGKINPEQDGESMRLTPRSIQRIVEKYVKITGLTVKATPQTLRQLHRSRFS